MQDTDKERLRHEQVEANTENNEESLEYRLEKVEKLLLANVKMTGDLLHICNGIAKSVSVYSNRETNAKLPVQLPCETLQKVKELEEWVQQTDQNYSYWVSLLVVPNVKNKTFY